MLLLHDPCTSLFSNWIIIRLNLIHLEIFTTAIGTFKLISGWKKHEKKIKIISFCLINSMHIRSNQRASYVPFQLLFQSTSQRKVVLLKPLENVHCQCVHSHMPLIALAADDLSSSFVPWPYVSLAAFSTLLYTKIILKNICNWRNQISRNDHCFGAFRHFSH